MDHATKLTLTASIVSAYVSHNTVPVEALQALLKTTFATLGDAENPVVAEVASEKPVPAVPIKKSVYPDYLVCLFSGAKMKMLKRHLATSYNMTPDQYRAHFGLPNDYPMTSPNYAAKRSELAKSIGLGRKSTDAVQETVVEAVKEAGARKGRGPGKKTLGAQAA